MLKLTLFFQCGRCETTGKYCLRRADQEFGARCTSCATSRRKCSLVPDVKPGRSSPTKASQSLDVEIPVETSSSKRQKGKGVLSALTQSFKRKINDRSPEVAQSAKKTSVRQPSPTLSTMQLPRSEIGEPPLTRTPSYISFESFESSANFEADHLRLLLNASQEDLRLERSRFEEREKRQAETFERERQLYASRIRELEKRIGEGSSSYRK